MIGSSYSPSHLASHLALPTHFSLQYPYIVNKRSYSDGSWRNRPRHAIPDYDILDPVLNEKRETLSPIFLDDLNSYNRYSLLGVKEQKKVRKYVYGFKKWNFVKDFEIQATPENDYQLTLNYVIPHVKNLLNSLEDNTVYKCIVVGIADFEIKTAENSFFISIKSRPESIAHDLITFSNGIHMSYLSVEFTSWKLGIRKWLGKEDINNNFDALITQLECQNKKRGKLFQKRNYPSPLMPNHDWLCDSTKNKCEFRGYDNITIANYGSPIHNRNGWYKHNTFDLNVVVVGEEYHVALYKDNILRDNWIDRYRDSGSWIRDFRKSGLLVYYQGNSYKHAERIYKTSEWQATNPENVYDNNIGSLDIETFTENNGIGVAIPYAAGFRKICGHQELFYLNNNEEPTDMMCRLLNRLLQPHNNGWLFYVHNLARFDSRFILAALGRMGLKPRKLLGRAINQIFFISLSTKIDDKVVTVNLTDSMYILSSSLDSLGKKFNSEQQKGVFPYSFVNAHNLEYKGVLPPFNFYNKLDKKDYDQLAARYNINNPWCMKTETLDYLEKDLICLINVMSTFNKSIFDKFQVNTTKVRSYSALSKLVYTTNFYNETSHKIPVIDGYIEKIIRQGYYGGLVDVVEHLVTNAFKYDANSHYPAAMLNDMPVGHPVISDEKDINKVFGYCHAKVTAPSEEILTHPTLPFRDTSGVTTCPRGNFEGVWFSEELKDNIKRGYKVEIVSSVVLKRGKGLFDKFINNLFSSKAKAKEEGDSVGELVYKLLMNSFYGKCGQLELENTYSMVENDKLDQYGKTHNYDLAQEFDKLTLIRENCKFHPALVELLKENRKGVVKNHNTSGKGIEDNTRLPSKPSNGVKSCVAIAAAITAYARVTLNRYKNIPGNKYLGGDTDSVIMQKRLASEYVGKELGMMKFEDDIPFGLFADKKLYYAINSKGKENIKSRGVGKDFNRKDILKLPHFLLMLAGHVVSVNKTKFVITQNGAVEIKNVSLHTKIQKLTYQNVLIELEGYLSNPNHPKYHIARYITSLRNISDSQMKVLLMSDSKYLLKLFYIKPIQKEGDNINVFSRVNTESLTIYNANRFKVVLHPKVTSTTLDKKYLTHPPPRILIPARPVKSKKAS